MCPDSNDLMGGAGELRVVLEPAWGRTSWRLDIGAGAGRKRVEQLGSGHEAGVMGRSVHALNTALGCVLPVVLLFLGTALTHWLPPPRLAEKKASIGYTYEDSTVAEVEKVAEKPEEEESPAEEESNSDEDEVIPDIGGVPSLPSPTPQSLGIVFVSRPSPSVGHPVLTSPVSCPCSRVLQPPAFLPVSLMCSSLPGLRISLSFPGHCFYDTVPTWVLAPFSSTWVSLSVSLPFPFSLLWQTSVQL